MNRTIRGRSLDEIGGEEPPNPDLAAEPATVRGSEIPAPPDPIDLSSSARALEERQIRWIRLRERWVRKRATKDGVAAQVANPAESSATPPPGP